jgi:mono/diheme cytochrome c family protein
MRNFLYGVLVTLAVLILGALAYLRLGLAEVRADLPPSRWETSLMTSAVRASIRRQAPERSNPVPVNDETLIAGAKIYLNGCSGCHGSPGKPSTTNGAELFPPVPQVPELGSQLTEAQIFWVAKHGIRRTGMFASGFWTSDEDLWKVSAFLHRLRSLPPAVEAEVNKQVKARH